MKIKVIPMTCKRKKGIRILDSLPTAQVIKGKCNFIFIFRELWENEIAFIDKDAFIGLVSLEYL